jgi:ABC-type antimicrobial peptide transport system permease subunit
MGGSHTKAGYNHRILFGKGAASSNVTITGLATDDTLLQVHSVILGTDGTLGAITDKTSVSTITGANTINVAGAAHTAKTLFIVHFLDKSA